MRVNVAVVIWLWSVSAALAQELLLRDGQKLFTFDATEQRVRTADVEIVLAFEEQGVQPSYRVELFDFQTGLRNSKTFDQDPTQPKLVALNNAHYCQESIYFLTLRYAPPQYADGRSYFFETHAFDAETLEYRDTAPVAFEDISLQEIGADLGFPYIAPQPYGVACSDAGLKLIPVLTDEGGQQKNGAAQSSQTATYPHRFP